MLKDFFGWLRNKYQKYKNEENPSRKEEKVYSLKKIDDDLNEDNENCLSSMITSVVPTSRHGNLRKSLERVNTLDHKIHFLSALTYPQELCMLICGFLSF